MLQSPARTGEAGEAYSQGWSAINRMVRQGYSWNGNERHVALLNLGRSSFADVSSASGLDFKDDGKWKGVAGGDRNYAFAKCDGTPIAGDWDGDGITDVGVVRKAGNTLAFILDTPAGPQLIFFGDADTDEPIVGDWDGDGVTDIGVVREQNGAMVFVQGQ